MKEKLIALLSAFLIIVPLHSCKSSSSDSDSLYLEDQTRPIITGYDQKNATPVYVDPLIVAGIKRLAIVETADLGLNTATDNSDKQSQIIAIASALGASLLIAGAIGVHHHYYKDKPSTMPILGRMSPASAEEEEAIRKILDTPSRQKSLFEQEKVSILHASTSKIVSSPKAELTIPPSLDHLSLFKVKNAEEIQFKQDEEAVLLLLKDDHQMVSACKKADKQSIVRGTTEYRLIKTENGQALFTAFDLRISADLRKLTRDIAMARTKKEAYIPNKTFRNDQFFPVKTKLITHLGTLHKPLRIGDDGSFTFDGMTYHYQVDKELGRGGFGQVLKVDLQDESKVLIGSLAVKQPVAGTDKPPSPYSLKSFDNETAYLQMFSKHPNGMQFYGAFPLNNNHYALAMELVRGDWISREFLLNYGKPIQQRAFISAASSIATMHASQWVHYDLKPDNLFYNDSGAKLGDFGFVKKVDENFRENEIYGTFRSSEAAGKSTKNFPYSEDVYALGVSMLQTRRLIPIPACCSIPKPLPADYSGLWRLDHQLLLEAMDRPSPISALSPEERELFSRMIGSAEQRPTMAEVAKELRDIYKIDAI